MGVCIILYNMGGWVGEVGRCGRALFLKRCRGELVGGPPVKVWQGWD